MGEDDGELCAQEKPGVMRHNAEIRHGEDGTNVVAFAKVSFGVSQKKA